MYVDLVCVPSCLYQNPTVDLISSWLSFAVSSQSTHDELRGGGRQLSPVYHLRVPAVLTEHSSIEGGSHIDFRRTFWHSRRFDRSARALRPDDLFLHRHVRSLSTRRQCTPQPGCRSPMQLVALEEPRGWVVYQPGDACTLLM